jgi:hypothetical protein
MEIDSEITRLTVVVEKLNLKFNEFLDSQKASTDPDLTDLFCREQITILSGPENPNIHLLLVSIFKY